MLVSNTISGNSLLTVKPICKDISLSDVHKGHMRILIPTKSILGFHEDIIAWQQQPLLTRHIATLCDGPSFCINTLLILKIQH